VRGNAADVTGAKQRAFAKYGPLRRRLMFLGGANHSKGDRLFLFAAIRAAGAL
jgi:hypothetical protein